MARNREYDEEYTGMDDANDQMFDDQEAFDAGDDEELDDPGYDEFDDEYDEYDDDAEEDGEQEEKKNAGFLSTLWGKVLAGVIFALVLVIVALLTLRFVSGREAPEMTHDPLPLPTQDVSQAATKAPDSVVFAPVDPTATPTAAPVVTSTPTASPTATPTATPVPTNTPEPTATPLPIILSNTPTPSPTPTATPTPSPSPTPTPSPKPTATPRVDLAQAETNREAKLRESASGSAKVKKTLKKGEALTVHEAALDKDGKVWYYVSANDLDTQGWMRDYVINVEGKIDVPTPTPKVTATPKAQETNDAEQSPTPAPQETEETVGIGTGKTNKDTNVRKIMNGKVITQLRKGKAVVILDAKLDKNGDLWYEIQVKGQTTRGFVRDYLIKLDKGVVIDKPTPTPKASEEPKATEAPKQEEAAAAQTDDKGILDREVVGKAKANRSANVRVKPVSGAQIVRQLSKGTELMILDCYQEGKNLWYEVATESGKTYGFVRDYVIDISQIKNDLEMKTYAEPVSETTEKQEETAAEETKAEEKASASKFRYAGNKQTKVFHTMSCAHVDSIADKNVVYMESRSYAAAKGYKPCITCKP